MKLDHSRFYRGGVTSSRLYESTNEIHAEFSDQNLQLRFSLPSKGGGNTAILVTIDDVDLRRILNGIAKNIPNLADAFTEGANEAVSKLLLQRHLAWTVERAK
jgi:hypothetical protein